LSSVEGDLRKMFKKSQKGFTIIELIATLVLIGILTVVAVSRFINFGAEVVTGADTLKMHIRYAQTKAMNSDDDTVWGIRCDGSSYWLFKGTDPSKDIALLPEDEKYLNDNKINLTKKKISVTSFTVLFDNRGIPYSAYPGTQWVGAAISVTPASGSGTTVTVNITPLTGYIP